jgi:hypothetical protein
MAEVQSCELDVWFSALHCNGLELLFVGLPLLRHIQSLADVAMPTNACNLLLGKNDIKPVMLPW